MKKQFKYLFYYLILFGMVPSFTQAGVVKMDLASTTGVLTEISNENINIKIGDLNLPSRINSETRFLGREGKPLSIEEIKLLLTKFKDLGFSGIPVKSNYNKTGVAKDIQLDFQSFDNANKNLIKNIQVLLNSLGYEPGPIDGAPMAT